MLAAGFKLAHFGEREKREERGAGQLPCLFLFFLLIGSDITCSRDSPAFSWYPLYTSPLADWG
jgi:hypothetical protein